MLTTGLPEELPYVETTDKPVPSIFTPVMMNAVNDSFKKRTRYNYSWANGVEMGNATGMVEGSRGYRQDIKTEYIYSVGQWRLATPHAEFTADNGNYPNSQLQLAGIFTLDATNTTDPEMATPGPNGILVISNPGIYAISTVTFNRNVADTAYVAQTGRGFLDLSMTSGNADLQRVSINVGEDRGSIAVPNVRVTAANQQIWFQMYRTVADLTARCKTRARVTRIA